VLAVVVVAGCGSSSNSGGSGSGSASAPSSATTPSTTASATGPTIRTTEGKVGTFLVDSQGRTLYLFEADKNGRSACSGDCAMDWPPMTTTGAPVAGSGVTAGWLGTVKRADGVTQVTYAGHPLYTYEDDRSAGQTTGQGVSAFGAEWYVVNPASGSKVDNDDEHDSGSDSGGY